VVVVVLGDFGRSPRMQYHALSLAEQAGRCVHVVAYAGSAPHEAVASHPRITLHALPPPPAALGALPRALALACKALLQLCALLWALLVRVPPPSHYLLQTPPCVPTFAACQLAACLRRARLVCDWHNFGYSLMALAPRTPRLLLRAAEAYERALGRRAHAHLCVTRAMAAELAKPSWGVRGAVVLHDRPAAMFCGRATAAQAHELLARLAPALAASPAARADDWAAAELAGASAADVCVSASVCAHALTRYAGTTDARTVLTQRATSRRAPTRRPDRPALVVRPQRIAPSGVCAVSHRLLAAAAHAR
jgi:beta-1,4-mannosyltransferase